MCAATLDFIGDPALVVGAGGAVLQANRPARALFGDRVRPGAVLGRPVGCLGTARQVDAVPPGGPPQVVELAAADVTSSGEPARIVTLRPQQVALPLHEALAAAREISRHITAEDDPDRLLDRSCALLVERGGFRASWAVHRGSRTVAQHRAPGEPAVPAALGAAYGAGGEDIPCVRLARRAPRGAVALGPGAAPCAGCATRCRNVDGHALVAVLADHGVERGAWMVGAAEPLERPLIDLLTEVATELGVALRAMELEHAQRRALRRLQEAEEVAGMGFVDWDLATGAVSLSPHAAELFEVADRPWRIGPLLDAACHPEDRARVDARLREAARGAAALDLDHRIVGPGGKVRWVHARARLVREPGPRLLLTVVDITERKEASRALEDALASLQRSELRFRAIFDGAVDGIAICGLDRGEVLMANPAMHRILRHAPGALHGRVVPGLIPADVPTFSPHAAPPIRGVAMEAADGTTVYCDVCAVRAEIDGRPAVVASVRDVTERRKLEAGVAQSEQLASLGMLAAGVAHEINNPLSYVMIHLDELVADLARWDPSGEGARPDAATTLLERARQAREGVRRIHEIARGLGTFSRVDPTPPHPVDVHGPVRLAMNMARHEIRSRARLVGDLQPVPPVLASEGRLGQVVLNLLINAAHAIPEGAPGRHEIRVRTWAEDDHVHVAIEDTGEGIPPELLERVFEPFFTTKPPGIGSGLGLSICRSIAAEFGGDLRIHSTVGVGTRVVLRLPQAPAPTTTHATLPAASQESIQPARLLIVDDEPLVRRALRRVLAGTHEVVAVDSGTAARELLEVDRAFDLVLCDMMLGDLSGMALHAWLVERDRALARRVVFLTGGAFTAEARAYLAETAVPALHKPFRPAELREQVARWLRRARREGLGGSAG